MSAFDVAREPWNWQATALERAAEYPCDGLMPDADHTFFRAIDVAAPAALTYRWLKQLRIAPYSYDLLDNFALPSPRRLTPRAATISVDQRIMHIFRIVAFEEGRSLTIGPSLAIGERLFGRLVGSYVVHARSERASRLIVKVLARYPRGLYGAIVNPIMPAIDLIMMRKQLQTLAAYAERDARLLSVSPPS